MWFRGAGRGRGGFVLERGEKCLYWFGYFLIIILINYNIYLNNADMKNCEEVKCFGYIYIGFC